MSLEQLTQEYNDWTKKFGDGRDKDGVRFGQHIYNKYSVESHSSYNKESANEAYTELIKTAE